MGNKLAILFGTCTIIFMLFGIFSQFTEIRTMAILLTTIFAMLLFHSAEQYVKRSISHQVEYALKKDHKFE
nr:hypothetical protein [Nanoarchaeum sp.]